MVCRICNAEIIDNLNVCSKCGNDVEITKNFLCQNCGEIFDNDIDYELIALVKKKKRKEKSKQIINLLPDWRH